MTERSLQVTCRKGRPCAALYLPLATCKKRVPLPVGRPQILQSTSAATSESLAVKREVARPEGAEARLRGFAAMADNLRVACQP